MIVADLLASLQKLPPNAEVFIAPTDWQFPLGKAYYHRDGKRVVIFFAPTDTVTKGEPAWQDYEKSAIQLF